MPEGIKAAMRRLKGDGYTLGPPVVVKQPFTYENRWFSKLRKEVVNDDQFSQGVPRTMLR